MTKKSEIRFTVLLDDKKMPDKIEWEATDADFEGKKECSSMMISLWDKEEKHTLGIDLWTKEMLVNDMNVHYHQVLNKLADTYERSTGNKDAGNMIRKFSAEFAEKTEIINKK